MKSLKFLSMKEIQTKRFLPVLLLFFLMPLLTFGQKTVSGTILSAEGEPLIGANVLVKGTDLGTITDLNGSYTIEGVPDASDVLVVSFIGYTTEELIIDNRNTVDVLLTASASELEELIVVGYGTQKKVNLTGSVVSVSSAQLVKRPGSNVTSLLQGKAPGLEAFQTSGQAGKDDAVIRIRGQGTFSSAGNQPLVLIDGVQGSLTNLDPNDIESISVLKDAASSSIYGARAANGVILVTTKQGSAGGFNIQYHGTFRLEQATSYPDKVTNSVEYMELSNIAEPRGGNGSRIYSQQQIDAYRNSTDTDQFPNFDHIDNTLNNAFAMSHHLSINGSDDATSYNFSLGYVDQDGIIDGIDYKKYNTRLNIQTEKDIFTVGANIGLQHSIQNDWWYPAPMWATQVANPLHKPFLNDGSGRYAAGAYFPAAPAPQVLASEGNLNTVENNVTAQAYVGIKLLEGLTWTTKGSIVYNSFLRKDHEPAPADLYYYQPPNDEPYRQSFALNLGVTDRQETRFFPTLYSTLNYDKTIADDHSIGAFVGYQQEYEKYNYVQASRREFGIGLDQLQEINAGGQTGQQTLGSSEEWAIQSFFGRINYAYKGKYLLEGNFRYDGTSRIAPDTRWGFFPSVSAGWRISEEIQSLPWLDDLKLRASWGKLGNQNIGIYPYQSVLSTASYVFGQPQQGIRQTDLTDKGLQWETTTITDIGIDMNLGNGLFSLTADWYNKVTDGILHQSSIPWSVGLNPPVTNFASMKNTGFEFTVGHTKAIGQDFRYGVNFNFSTYNNEVTKVARPTIGGERIIREGLPWNSFYLTEWIGIFQNQAEIDAGPEHQFNPQPGDLKFQDQNGDGVINAEDRKVFDGAFPDFNYGGTIFLSWKNFDLNAFFYGETGRKYSFWLWVIDPFLQGAAPTRELADNYWRPDRPTNEYPALYKHFYPAVQGTRSTYYLWDGTYFRLKNLQIGYTLPERSAKKIGLQALRIYLSGDNLATITNFRFGGDPEYQNGFFQNYHPQLRVYTAGVNAKF